MSATAFAGRWSCSDSTTGQKLRARRSWRPLGPWPIRAPEREDQSSTGGEVQTGSLLIAKTSSSSGQCALLFGRVANCTRPWKPCISTSGCSIYGTGWSGNSVNADCHSPGVFLSQHWRMCIISRFGCCFFVFVLLCFSWGVLCMSFEWKSSAVCRSLGKSGEVDG